VIDQRSSKRPLNCGQVRRVLQAYLDGALDDTMTREVARHLETCHRCQREAEDYQAIKRSLRRLQQTSRAVQRLREFGEALRDNHED
jgi:anti-sigma factor (TIGR02949 family)